MTLIPRLAALAAALALLATGCTGEDEPTAESTSDSTPTSSPTDATESPTGSAIEDLPAVVFHSGSEVTADAPCGKPATTYLSMYEELDVNRDVRFGTVTPVGGGRLFGRVFLAPTPARGPNDGTLAIDGKPGWGPLDDSQEWRDRVSLRGRLVQPGTYAVLAQVTLRPGTRMEALDFSFSDSSTTGSARLDVSAAVDRTCRG